MIKEYHFSDSDLELKETRDNMLKVCDLLDRYVQSLKLENKALNDYLMTLREENRKYAEAMKG